MVKKARQEEIGYIKRHGVYRKVKRTSIPKGTAVIQVRRIDINKGGDVNPEYRSRLVAKEIKTHRNDALFAATPPWETVKMVFSMVAKALGLMLSQKTARA